LNWYNETSNPGYLECKKNGLFWLMAHFSRSSSPKSGHLIGLGLATGNISQWENVLSECSHLEPGNRERQDTWGPIIIFEGIPQ
jgi:hypothetical protein